MDFLTEYGKENKATKVLVRTTMGDIKVKLHTETPLHRANFLYLIERGYFKNTVFYRVVKNFVVQGGNSDEAIHTKMRRKIGTYTLPPEFKPHLIHKKGALSIAREYDNNPEKRSSPYDFFFVHGMVYDARQIPSLNVQQTKAYTTVGGAPNLDMEHTVFGQVIDGIEIIDKIANVKVDKGDWPITNVYIKSIEVL